MPSIIFGFIGLLVGAAVVYVLLVIKLQHQLEGARRKLERAEQAGGDALDLQQQRQELEERCQYLQQQVEDYQAQIAQLESERNRGQQQIADLQSRLESEAESGQGNASLAGVVAVSLAAVSGLAAHEFLSEQTPATGQELPLATEVTDQPWLEEPPLAALETLPSEPDLEQAIAPEENWVDAPVAEAPTELQASLEPPSWETLEMPGAEFVPLEPESSAAEITSPFTEEGDNWVDTGDLAESLASQAPADFPELTVAEIEDTDATADLDLEEFGTSPATTLEPEGLFGQEAISVLEDLPVAEESPLVLEEFSSTDNELELPADFLAELATDQVEVEQLTEEITSTGEELDFLMELQQSEPEAPTATDLFADLGDAADNIDIPGLDLFTEAAEEIPDLSASGSVDNLADRFMNILDIHVDRPDPELMEFLQSDSQPFEKALEPDFLDSLDDLFAEDKPATPEDNDLDAFLSGPALEEVKTEAATDTLDSLEELLASDPRSLEEWGLPSEPSSEYPFQ